MSSSTPPTTHLTNSIKHEVANKEEYSLQKYHDIIATLPSHNGWDTNHQFYKYGKFWYPYFLLAPTMAIHDTFQSQPSDLFIATYPKSGTTWIIAIMFSIINRNRFAFDDQHPLLTSNPHDCLRSLEVIYMNNAVRSHLEELSSPRLFATHIPYSALPSSVADSNCRIIYLCRNPKDTFVSYWHFMNKMFKGSVISFDEVFELFCEGYSINGPIWEHVLEYWMENLKNPDKILFLKYEDLKAEPVKNVMKLAKFSGYDFSEAEVKEGMVEEIVKLCSFDNLSNLEVNKNGIQNVPGLFTMEYSSFFRKGNVGDWKEYLTSDMAKKNG